MKKLLLVLFLLATFLACSDSRTDSTTINIHPPTATPIVRPWG